MQHLLSEFQKNRLDWAFDAKTDYLNKFRIFEAVEKTTENKKIVISVYGPTQVGKTTLILSLLGIKEQFLVEISEFLRGGRDPGNSATITVTKFQISPTEDYIIKLPNHKETIIHTSEQLEEHMAQLRNDVETGVIQSIDPVIVAIPKSKFHDQGVTIELIDLPGIESAEKKEVQHVERCVKYWVPNSHVCLIVNSAMDLTFLRDIQMPQLKNWYDYPENYFVVLTRAFSPESIPRRINNNEIKNADDVITYYNDEIQKILNHSPESFYPIEIGQSLKLLSETERLMADDIFNRLKEKIQSVDFHKISFSFLTGYYNEIVKQSEKEVRRLESEIDEQREEYSQLLSLLTKNYEERDSALTEINDEKAILEETRHNFTIDFKDAFESTKLGDIVENRYEKAPIDKKPSKLNQLASGVIFEVEEQIKETLDHLNAILEEVNNVCNLLPYEKLVMNVNGELDFYNWDRGKKLDIYLSQKKYLEKRESMRDSLLVSVRETSSIVKNAREDVFKKWSSIEEDLHSQERRLNNKFTIREEELQELLHLKNEKIQQLEEDLQLTVKYWKKDLEHATNYRKYFIQHFLKRKEQLLKMATSNNFEEKYLANLYLYVLSSDATKIIDSLEYKNDDKTTITK